MEYGIKTETIIQISAYLQDRILVFTIIVWIALPGNLNTQQENKEGLPMQVYEGIQLRRSIRQYDKKPIEKETIEKLLRAAMQAPSAANQQPWEFLVVENDETLQKLSTAHVYATPMKNAALAIIVLAKEEGLRFPQYWQQDLAAATQNILLAAVELGLGAVWMGVAPEEDRMTYIQELFQLPQGVKAFAMLAIGYSSDNKFIDRFDANRIHYEKY